MRHPQILEDLNHSVSSIVQLVLTIHNPIALVKNYVRMDAYYILANCNMKLIFLYRKSLAIVNDIMVEVNSNGSLY